MIRTLLAVIAMTAMIGSAQALDQTVSVGPLSPTVGMRTDFSSQPMYSFKDVFSLDVGTRFGTMNASPVRYTPDGIDIGSAHLTKLKLEQFASPDAFAPAPGAASSMNGARIDLKPAREPRDRAARASEMAAKEGDELLVSIAAVPEPSGWAMLLCGFVVVAFIARRKTSLTTG